MQTPKTAAPPVADGEVDAAMARFVGAFDHPIPPPPAAGLKVGVDLGTANLVMAVLDDDDRPLGGARAPGVFVRDGVVVDFAGAIDATRQLRSRLEADLGTTLHRAHGGVPPGLSEATSRAVIHVIEAAEMDCTGLVDEPTAANAVLGLREGIVVDVGGGSTGVAVIRGGRVVHVADEATGGWHFTLVLAGALGLDVAQAEQIKRDPSRQREIRPHLEAVMEKIAAIVSHQIAAYPGLPIHLVGGSAMFPGFATVLTRMTGHPTHIPAHPLFVSPLGIARSAPTQSHR